MTKDSTPASEKSLARRVIERRITALQTRTRVLTESATAALLATPIDAGAGLANFLTFKTATKGLLLGLGDSWYQYFAMDVLDILQDSFAYTRRSVAEAGASLKSVATTTGQLDRLSEEIENTLGHARPTALFLSGGGNDVVDFGIENLLNPASPGVPPLNDAVVTGFVDGAMKQNLIDVLRAITGLSDHLLALRLPIFFHGYDYPVPDGRGLIIPKRGPWLKPGFVEKGYGADDQLPLRKSIMKDLIDRLNTMQKEVAAMPEFKHVVHVDLRGTLPPKSTDDYRLWWSNELHPTRSGFELIAKKFADKLASLPLL